MGEEGTAKNCCIGIYPGKKKETQSSLMGGGGERKRALRRNEGKRKEKKKSQKKKNLPSQERKASILREKRLRFLDGQLTKIRKEKEKRGRRRKIRGKERVSARSTNKVPGLTPLF